MPRSREVDYELVKSLRDKGLSHASIADAVKCSRSTVRYILNKAYRATAITRATRNKRNNKEAAVKYKGGKCELCGYNKCIDALEFHHVSEKKLLDNFVRVGALNKKRKEELKNCMLLCANCHREIHHQSNHPDG